MDQALFLRAADFIWRNARLLDRRLFAFYFLGDSPRLVANALKAYQNEDGGFGSALEPDKRTPHSHPVDVQVALETLDQVDLLRDPGVQLELILPACEFLQTIATEEGGVPFSLPTANPYPKMEWWEAPEHPPAALNPTAAIAGMLLKSGVEHPWLAGATEFCWRNIATSETTQYHDLLPMIAFLIHVPERDRAEKELARIADRIRTSGVVSYDRKQPGYLKFPLDWAPTPQHFCRSLFSDEVIRNDLRGLADQQQPDGGWPISWQPVSTAVELEWRGSSTVQALWTLACYEREAG